jgi:DHA1 family bicyclomycin/chloramphenicol resistance-like MFS transporter
LNFSRALTQRQRWVYILILGGMMAMQPFALDPYLPAAPSIAATFMAPDAQIQLTMSALTLGFALGQMITGPLSDALGRKRPIIVAAALYVVACIVVMTAPNLIVFAIGRVLQGVAGASIQVVGNAIMRDLYAGAALMKMMSRVFLIQALSWFVGPLGATLLLDVVDWRVMTGIIAIYGAILLTAATRVLTETLPGASRTEHGGVRAMASRFAHVLKDRPYLGIVLIGVLNSTALFGYLSVMPFVYQNRFGFDGSQYGYFFVLNSASAYIGVQVIAWLAKKFELKWVVLGVLVAQVGVGGLVLIAGLIDAPFLVLQAALMTFTFFMGGSFAPMGTMALTRHGDEAGTAAALNMVAGSLGSTLAAPLYANLGSTSSIGLGVMLICLYALAILVMFAVVRPRQLAAT